LVIIDLLVCGVRNGVDGHQVRLQDDVERGIQVKNDFP
jgi:hypothetical protein